MSRILQWYSQEGYIEKLVQERQLYEGRQRIVTTFVRAGKPFVRTGEVPCVSIWVDATKSVEYISADGTVQGTCRSPSKTTITGLAGE